MGLTTVIKDYGTEILNAIRENDLQKLKSILEKQLKADKKIQRLCVSDIKHKPTKKFACPLILAARQEDPRIMKYMMDKGVDPNFVHHTIFSSKRKEIVTALHISVDLGLYDTVQILLDANADPNIGDHNQETPLHIAVKKADKVLTRMLLSKGADPKIPDRRGNAALHVATQYGHLQLVRTLLKYDADVYQKGQWDAVPPHIAAKEGHIHLIQLFCSRDVGNINIKIPCYLDKREKAPIHLAAENGHVETVLALVDQFDAEVNLKDSDGNTPLHCVVLNQYNPHRMRDKEYFNETAKVLIKFGVSINEKNIYGDTALHLAAMNQFQRIVELLLEIGASPFIENDEKLKAIDVVPDFDPVTKQVLKNAMLNPRPAKSASRSTLLSHDMSMISGGQNVFKKPRSISSSSPDPTINESVRRSHSRGSINSSVTIESSVFDDPMKHQKYFDNYQSRHRGKHTPSSNESDRYNDDDQNSSIVYSKVNKPKKQTTSGQQTDRRQNFGTQYDDNESVSMISVQDHMTQVSMKTESTVVNNQLRHILNKDRKQMGTFDEDDRIESVSDITSIQGSESTYMSMDSKNSRKQRPKPRPRPTQKSEGTMPDESVVYENLKPEPPPPLPSRNRQQSQSTTSLNQQRERLPSAGQAGGIRLIPGKNGTIEVQYGGYGGTPITIQFDGQYGLQQGSGSQVNLATGQSTPGYPDNDQYSSFSVDTVQTAHSEAYQPGFTPGSYGYHAGDLSMDSTEMESTHVTDFQRDAVRNAIQQKVVDMTSDGRGGAAAHPSRRQGKPQQQQIDEEEEEEDDLASAGQFNTQQYEAQQAFTQQQLQQAMEQLGQYELNQQQLQSIHQQLQQLMLQQQELQMQHQKFQEAQQKALSSKTKKKKPKSKTTQVATEAVAPEPTTKTAQRKKPKPMSPLQSTQETFVINEDEVVPSPDLTPNEGPQYMNFSQALAFAKSIEAKSAESSPVTQRKLIIPDERAGPVPKPRQQPSKAPKPTPQMVSTPEKNKWDVKAGTATTVEMSTDRVQPHMSQTGHASQMRQTTVESAYITGQSYVSSAEVSYQSSTQDRNKDQYTEDSEEEEEEEEEEYQTEEEEERPPQEVISQMTNNNKRSYDMYYSITPEVQYQETSSGRQTPDELSSYQPQRSQQMKQSASQPFQVSDEVAVPSVSTQLAHSMSPENVQSISKAPQSLVEGGSDEVVQYEEEAGLKRMPPVISDGAVPTKIELPETQPHSTDTVNLHGSTTSSPEKDRSASSGITSPTPDELRTKGAKTPESFFSETSSRSGLNMRVTGETPKAYTRAQKGSARRAFILHPPVGIESGSELSDTEGYDSRSRFPSRSLYSPSGTLSPSQTLSPSRSPSQFEFKERPAKSPTRLIGAPIPKPYKSFGKIETKTDALEEAIAEAEAREIEELRRAQERHATRHELEAAKQDLIQKHIEDGQDRITRGIEGQPLSPPPDLETFESMQDVEKLQHDLNNLQESLKKLQSDVDEVKETTVHQVEVVQVDKEQEEHILSDDAANANETTEDESPDEDSATKNESSDSESSDSSDQGEFDFETGQISAEVEEMDDLEDMGGIEPIESVYGSRRKAKPRPSVDPAKVEAARKAAEARKSPANTKGKTKNSTSGSVSQPLSVSVSKSMMRRRMSPRTPTRTPILAETIEEAEEPIEEESGESESNVDSEEESGIKKQQSQSDKTETEEDEQIAVVETDKGKETVLLRTVKTQKTVTVFEQRVNESGEIETVTTTTVKPDNKAQISKYAELAQGETFDTSSEIEKYDEEFHPDLWPQSQKIEEIVKQEADKVSAKHLAFIDDEALLPEGSAPTENKKGRTIQTTQDPEDDEVAQISAAAEERKVSKKKKKKKDSTESNDDISTEKKTKKKKRKPLTEMQSADYQPEVTETGQLSELTADKPKKKKKKEKDSTATKKKKKKKDKTEAVVDDNSSQVLPDPPDYEQVSQDVQKSSHWNKEIPGEPLTVNTTKHMSTDKQSHLQHSALDPLSPKSDTSEASFGSPEGIEATMFGSKLDRQDTVKENKDGPKKAGFWAERKVLKETPEDIKSQYKSQLEYPHQRLDFSETEHEEYMYGNSGNDMRRPVLAPSSQRQPPIGEERELQGYTTTSSTTRVTDLDTVMASQYQHPVSEPASVLSSESKATPQKQKPALPKKPPKELLRRPILTSSPINASPQTERRAQTTQEVQKSEWPADHHANQQVHSGATDLDKVAEMWAQEMDIPQKGQDRQTDADHSIEPEAQSIRPSKWGKSHEMSDRQPSVDETQMVSQLWKDTQEHEAEMQRILASMSDNDMSVEDAVTAEPETKWGKAKKAQKIALEGQTVYVDQDKSEEKEAQIDIQRAKRGSWGRSAPEGAGTHAVVRPQPVYASSETKPHYNAEHDIEAVSSMWAAEHPLPNPTTQQEDDYIPVPSAMVSKEEPEDDHLEDDTPGQFHRQHAIRGKKAKKRKAPYEGMSGAISDTETLKRSVGYESDTGIHSEAELHDYEAELHDYEAQQQKPLQDIAMDAITSNLINQPKLKPRVPIWETEQPIHYTRGVYRPHNPPVLYGSSAYRGSYDDSSLAAQIFGERNKPAPFSTESEGEADSEFVESPAHSARPTAQYPMIAPHANSAFHPVSPANKKVTILDKQKKKKKKKDKAPKTEPGAIDLDQYSATARLWLEQVDKKTVEKSQTMKMAIMSENQRPPPEIVNNLPPQEMASDDVFLPPQWIIIRGRTLRNMKQSQALSTANKSYASDSEFDMNPDRPLSPGRQAILFFRLGSNWKDLAWVLFDGLLSDADTLRMIRDIQLKNPGNLKDQVNDMMKRWWKKSGSKATIDKLQRSLDFIHTAYIQEDFFNRRSTITSYTDTEDDLEIGEVEDNDPDVSRFIEEYQIRSLNSSFECEPPGLSSKPLSRDSVIRSLSEKGLLQRGRPDVSRDSIGRLSTASSGYYGDHNYRPDLSRDSMLDESTDRFLIIQPQLKHQEYRHETTI